MIKVQFGGRLIAIDDDDERVKYVVVRQLHALKPAVGETPIIPFARALVEVQRQHGGLAPRALLGGAFNSGVGSETRFEVSVGADFETLTDPGSPAPTIAGRLHHGWPYLVGLPEEFAPAVLHGLTDGVSPIALPAGVLTIDRAGFDERESASPVFELAAWMLKCVLAAKLQGGDVEGEIRSLLPSW